MPRGKGGISIKTQGFTQGLGVPTTGWGVINIAILNAHSWKGHEAKFICPIIKLSSHLSAILYVDSMDLLHIYLNFMEPAHCHSGALQPAKIFYSLILFKWVDGESGSKMTTVQTVDLECLSLCQGGPQLQFCTNRYTIWRNTRHHDFPE